MNTTATEHRGIESVSGQPRRRIRRHACMALVVLASAGLGAVAEGASAPTRVRPPVVVVPDDADSRCAPTQPRPRIELVGLRTQPCTKVPVLVGTRTAPRPSV